MHEDIPSTHHTIARLLDWYALSGLDEVLGSTPSDMFTWEHTRPPRGIATRQTTSQQNTPPQSTSSPQSATIRQDTRTTTGTVTNVPLDEAIAAAKHAAQSADTMEQLRTSIQQFTHCPLKQSARNTVIDDGIAHADLLVLGEAPGKEEDRIGKPFIGRAGQLLDAMLASIGQDRSTNTHIANVFFWRPPANRSPSKTEIAMCLPFVYRMLSLTRPKVIILTGNTPSQALLRQTAGITQIRGRWHDIKLEDGHTIPAMPLFHPAYLLRQPLQKRLAWHDLRQVRQLLTGTA